MSDIKPLAQPQRTQSAEEFLVVKKRIPVQARLVTQSEVVLTAHGRVRAEPGGLYMPVQAYNKKPTPRV